MASRLNMHIDESGNQDLLEGIYIVTVVLHDHSDNVAPVVSVYEQRLTLAELPDIPFHGKDLLHGNEGYRFISPGNRKRLLTQFSRFVRELPFKYVSPKYISDEVHNQGQLESRIRRDLTSLIYDNLSFSNRIRPFRSTTTTAKER